MTDHDPRKIPQDVFDLACDRALGEDVQGAVDEELALELELAAAAATAAMGAGEPSEPMPAALTNRIRARLADPAIEPNAGQMVARSDVQRTGSARTPWVSQLGWFAAAAAILLAAFAWLLPTASGPSTRSGQELFARLSSGESSARATWSLWPRDEANPSAQDVPFATTVSGEVIWNEAEQTGVMVFDGLPVNDPSAVQYQLWIIVPDQKHPIDGGVFDIATPAGMAYVPIDPKLPVRDAVAFAITMEKPGGVVVSDQDRRVVVAAPAKS